MGGAKGDRYGVRALGSRCMEEVGVGMGLFRDFDFGLIFRCSGL